MIHKLRLIIALDEINLFIWNIDDLYMGDNYRTHVRFEMCVPYAEYSLIKRGGTDNITYPTTDHLPKDKVTFKDNPNNIANVLKGVRVNDSIIFTCDPKGLRTLIGPLRDAATKELEAKVVEINEDKEVHQRKIKFELVR